MTTITHFDPSKETAWARTLDWDILIPLAEKTHKKLDTPEDLKALKTGLGLPCTLGNLGLYREPGASKLTLVLNNTLHIEIDVTKKEFIRCYNRVENAGNAKMDPELESLWNTTPPKAEIAKKAINNACAVQNLSFKNKGDILVALATLPIKCCCQGGEIYIGNDLDFKCSFDASGSFDDRTLEFIQQLMEGGNAKMDPELELLWNMTSRGGQDPWWE